jgi:hypothetical protein
MQYECHIDIIRMLKLCLKYLFTMYGGNRNQIPCHTQKVEIGIMWHGNVCGSFSTLLQDFEYECIYWNSCPFWHPHEPKLFCVWNLAHTL